MTTRRRVDCSCARVRHAHGTEAAYSRCGCRCMPCAIARSEYLQEWKSGGTPARTTAPIIGTRRRLQALTALGWSPPELGARLGLPAEVVRRLRSEYDQDVTVLFRTRDAVARLYNELWDQSSTGPHRRRMVNLAARYGWLPPLAWDDDLIDDPRASVEAATTGGVDAVAVERAIDGHPPVTLTKAERELATARLTQRGYSASEIADRLRVTKRQITRDRAA